MPRTVRGGLIQATLCEPATSPVEKIKKAMIDKHVAMIDQAAKHGVEVVCLQELFYGPYFCAEQEIKWYNLTEKIPEGPTTKLMMDLAKKHKMVIVVPMYEEDLPGIYYNSASATRCSTRRSAKSASTSATTATSPTAPAASASMARRLCSTRPPL
jgi:N-carbamoylputrescine amidase